jgi:hypothetical protein
LTAFSSCCLEVFGLHAPIADSIMCLQWLQHNATCCSADATGRPTAQRLCTPNCLWCMMHQSPCTCVSVKPCNRCQHTGMCFIWAQPFGRCPLVDAYEIEV